MSLDRCCAVPLCAIFCLSRSKVVRISPSLRQLPAFRERAGRVKAAQAASVPREWRSFSGRRDDLRSAVASAGHRNRHDAEVRPEPPRLQAACESAHLRPTACSQRPHAF
jgi:hypothetical protein